MQNNGIDLRPNNLGPLSLKEKDVFLIIKQYFTAGIEFLAAWLCVISTIRNVPTNIHQHQR